MIDRDLYQAFRFFHEHGTMRVGFHGVDALALARSEAWAKDVELEFKWEYDFDADPPAEGCEVLWCGVEYQGLRAGLGGIELRSPAFTYGCARDPYVRVVEAELAAELLQDWRAAEHVKALRSYQATNAVAEGWAS